MVDEIDYTENALKFPSLTNFSVGLPAVNQWTRRYGRDQPARIFQYTYTEENFLGNGAPATVFETWDKNRDYLYDRLTGYVYGSTQSIGLGRGERQEITRRYNNYHLLVSEETSQGTHIVRRETVYHAELNRNVADQPCFYHFPKRQTVRYMDASAGKTRQEQTDTTFDDYGNPLTIAHPDGTRETFSWYPAKGVEASCPAEPSGFVRFMKQHEVTPPTVGGYPVPADRVEYTYDRLGNTGCIVQVMRRRYSDDSLLGDTRTTYVADPASREFGRIQSITDTLCDLSDRRLQYVTSQDFKTEVDDQARMTQTVTSRAHDGLSTTHTRIQSVPGGHVLQDTDAHGIVTQYTYDSLGRILTETHAAGTHYSATTHWSYTIEKQGKDIAGPVTVREDGQGRKIRTRFDGAGRPVQHDVHDIDVSQVWYPVYARQYDVLGRMVAETHSDWTTEDRQQKRPVPSISSRTEYGYDGWGYRHVVRHPEGVESWTENDPVQLTQTTWQKSTLSAGLTGGRVLTKFDRDSCRPLSRTALRTSGEVEGTRKYEWDGLGRLRRETDERGHVTSRTYDVHGRVREQTLPDGSVVSRTYVPHLTGHQIANIGLTAPGEGALLQHRGEQWFDGLGRTIMRICGGRTTAYHYDAVPPAPKPDSITLPSGQTVRHTYIPELGFPPGTVSAEGITQTFQYDPKTAALLQASEDTANIDNQWFPSGAMKSQTFTRHGQARSVSYAQTLLARTEAYTDVTGRQTRYGRDREGRLTVVEDEVLRVALDYDALGRLHTQTVKDTAASVSLVTTLAYDDFSREITRTIGDGANVWLELRQTWRANSLLATRATCRDGHVVLNETYGYDNRNRLVDYQAASPQNGFPLDAYGHPMQAQQYHYDALNNLTTVITTLADGKSDTATFHYENADPAQLTSVTHTGQGYPSHIPLSYDREGRLSQDEAGRKLTYDALGRLSGAGEVRYGYDAQDHLIRQHISSDDVRELYCRGETLVNEVNAAQRRERRLIEAGDSCVGVSDGKDLTLMAGDLHGSPLWSHPKGQPEGEPHRWAPWGSGKGDRTLPGFNGERTDPVSGVYHLGNGYRAYSPALMRFCGPDSLSPFGAGGINPYAYCAGDPVNQTDPSGHLIMRWPIIAGIAVGVIGVVLSGATWGASIAAASSVIAAVTAVTATVAGVVSGVTAIASGVVAINEPEKPELAKTLGWISLGTGILSAITSLGTTIAYYGLARTVVQADSSASQAETNSIASDTRRLLPSQDEVDATALRKLPMRSSPADSHVNIVGGDADAESSSAGDESGGLARPRASTLPLTAKTTPLHKRYAHMDLLLRKGWGGSSRLLKYRRRTSSRSAPEALIERPYLPLEIMRGADTFTESLFSFRKLDDFVPASHPLRSIRIMANEALAKLAKMDRLFAGMYEADIKGGRPSIAPEAAAGDADSSALQHPLGASTHGAGAVQSAISLVHRPGWVPTVFTKNRERLIKHDAAIEFFNEVVDIAQKKELLSGEHFSVDGTLIQAWAGPRASCARTVTTRTTTAAAQATSRAASAATKRTSPHHRSPRSCWSEVLTIFPFDLMDVRGERYGIDIRVFCLVFGMTASLAYGQIPCASGGQPCLATSASPSRSLASGAVIHTVVDGDSGNAVVSDGSGQAGVNVLVATAGPGVQLVTDGQQANGILALSGGAITFQGGSVIVNGLGAFGVVSDASSSGAAHLSSIFFADSSIRARYVGAAALDGSLLVLRGSRVAVVGSNPVNSTDIRIGSGPYGLVAAGTSIAPNGAPSGLAPAILAAEGVSVNVSGAATDDDRSAGVAAFDKGSVILSTPQEGQVNQIVTSRDGSAGLLADNGPEQQGPGTIASTGNLSVSTTGTNAPGAVARNGGSISLSGGQILTGGNNSPGLYANGPGSFLHADNLGVNTLGQGSPALQLAGAAKASLAGVTLTTSQSSAVKIVGGAPELDLADSHADRNNGTWLEVGGHANANVLVISSTLTGSAVTAPGAITNIRLASGSSWTVGGNSNVTTLASDSSTIGFAAPSSGTARLASYKSLTVTGRYTGTNALLGLNVYLGGDGSPADRLVMDGGSATGNTRISITNTGGPGGDASHSGIKIVDAINGGTTTADAFSLAGRVRAGAFDYRLFRGNSDGSDSNSWFLRTDSLSGLPILGPEVATYSAVQPVARQLGMLTLGTLDERLCNGGALNAPREPACVLPDGVFSKDMPAALTAWGRVFGQHISNRYSSSADTRADGHIAGFQLGQDLWRGSIFPDHQDRLGLYFAYANANVGVNGLVTNGAADAYILSHTGDINLNAWTGGAYWTHVGPASWYLDTVLQATRYDGNASTSNARLDTTGAGFIGSLESGYPIPLSTFGPGFVLEPQAQILWQRVQFNRSHDVFGTVALGDTQGVTGRLGLDGKWLVRTASDQFWQPSVRINLWRDWGGKATTVFSGAQSIPLLESGYRLVSGAGLAAQIGRRLAFDVSIAYQIAIGPTDGHKRDGIEGSAGLKYRW